MRTRHIVSRMELHNITWLKGYTAATTSLADDTWGDTVRCFAMECRALDTGCSELDVGSTDSSFEICEHWSAMFNWTYNIGCLTMCKPRMTNGNQMQKLINPVTPSANAWK